eukprot:288826_1
MAHINQNWSTPKDYILQILNLPDKARKHGIKLVLDVLKPIVNGICKNNCRDDKQNYTNSVNMIDKISEMMNKITQIIDNSYEHQNEVNPTNLQFNTLFRKFYLPGLECLECIPMLFEAGFKIKYNHRCRIMFCENDLEYAKNVYNFLTNILKDNDSKYIEEYSRLQTLIAQNHLANECLGDIAIQDCRYIQALIQFLNEYHEIKERYSVEMKKNILEILNNFYHILLYHNHDDCYDVVNYIYKNIKKCKKDACQAVSRYFNRDNDIENTGANQFEILFLYIADNIHCHFGHCYEIAPRLSPVERQQVRIKSLDDKFT